MARESGLGCWGCSLPFSDGVVGEMPAVSSDDAKRYVVSVS